MKNKTDRVVMARLTKRGDDERSFDIEFWKRVGGEARFAATCAMVFEAELLRGKNAGQPGLERSVQNIIRRKG
jgi:hypothetical protein